MSETTVEEQRELLEQALFEIKRVIAGQDGMLERVLVCLLAGGHLLIEGVPGLAKTLTIKTTAQVLGGSFQRIQFTPDLVPSDLVGTRVFRPSSADFDTELGPVFCNFLLADEINRAPAKVQSALLEVMQERQVTIGHETHPSRSRSSSWRRRTRSSRRAPTAARGAGRPLHAQDPRRLPRARRGADGRAARSSRRPSSGACSSWSGCASCRTRPRRSTSTRASSATRSSSRPRPASRRRTASPSWRRSSPSAPARAGRSASSSRRALAFLRGRDYVVAQDVDSLAKDALRHRLVLSYQALAEQVDADRILDAVLEKVTAPELDVGRRGAPLDGRPEAHRARPTGRARAAAGDAAPRARPDDRAADRGDAGRRPPLVGARPGQRARAGPPLRPGDDVRRIEWNVTARTGETHVRVDLAERVLVTWLALDVSASMSFGTAERRKADVAEGVALALGHLASRRGNRLGLVASATSGRRRSRRAPAAPACSGCCSRCASRLEGGGATSLGAALGLVARMAQQRSLVAIVSDFRGPRDWRPRCCSSRAATTCSRSRSATRARRRCRTSASCGSSTRRPAASCASTRRTRSCASASPPRQRPSGRDREGALSLGVGHVVLSTEGDWLRPLALHLRRRGGRRELPPLALLALLAVPLAVFGYVLLERRRHRQAAAFATPRSSRTSSAAAPAGCGTCRPRSRCSRWRRSRPASRGRTRRSRSSRSRRRSCSRWTRPARWSRPTCRRAGSRSRSRRSAASSASCRRATASGWSRSRRARRPCCPRPRTARRAGALRNLRTGDGTALGEGIARAIQVAQRVPAEEGKPPASILVLSDGAQTQGVLEPQAAAARAKKLKIPVYTVAFGTDQGVVEVVDDNGFTQRVTVPPDPPTLRKVSQRPAAASTPRPTRRA